MSVSDNVGSVKWVLGVVTRALRRARHFALVESLRHTQPRLASIICRSGTQSDPRRIARWKYFARLGIYSRSAVASDKVTAVAMQIPRLLPLLYEGAHAQRWSIGSIFVIQYCRVGILNDIGELLKRRVAVL